MNYAWPTQKSQLWSGAVEVIFAKEVAASEDPAKATAEKKQNTRRHSQTRTTQLNTVISTM